MEATTAPPQSISPATTRGLPPGPPLPRAVQTAIWSRRTRPMVYACQKRYGDVFTLRIAYEGEWVMLGDPEAVKQVFTGDPRVYHAGEGNQILRPVLGDNSVLVLDEKPHMSQRRLLLPPFHGERMQGYAETMIEIAAREMDGWPEGEPYRLRPRMQAMTLEIIMRTVFGVREGGTLGELRGSLRDFLDLTTNPRLLLPALLLGPGRVTRVPFYRRRIERVDALINREIAARRAVDDIGERDDILSLLIQARHEDGSPMSDQEMRDELLTLLVAGHETTATALAWVVERLARHPDKLARLREEAETPADDYLTATIQETLRLRPVIPIVIRRLTEPVEIAGYELPAGASVTPSVYMVHRNREVYPDPDAFRPERFLESPPGTYTWIPFGGGVRRCLGASFAQFEMAVVLRELVRRFAVLPSRPEPERIYRRAITETPRHDAEVILN
ncbi:MAG TPA: cytochrome P450 [Solirubrobacterales bacterium]